MRGFPNATGDQKDFWDDRFNQMVFGIYPNLVFGRNVKDRPIWEATIILPDSRDINSPRGLG
jgi:hypothetical protein